MKLRHLSVRNYRGIKSLDWHLDGAVICLVGAGDSGKTTILDAIDVVLAPRNYVTFTDTDFFAGDVDQSIVIEASVGELSEELVEERYGLFTRGYRPDQLLDDVEDDSEQVLTVRLEVTKDLEPTWTLTKPSTPEPGKVGWRDREKFGATRIGSDAVKHFAWGRGSSLSKATENLQPSGGMLAQIARAARVVVSGASPSEMQETADQVKTTAAKYGVALGDLRPGLDTQALTIGMGALSLHDDNIPLRSKGLGTRRVGALAVQSLGVGEAAITLIDEVEHGLEPFRIRQVLRQLCVRAVATPSVGQVVLTTHSPTVLLERDVTDLRFVRNERGVLTIYKVNETVRSSLQAIVRTNPLPFLSRKAVVCEGKTEAALCRALDEHTQSAIGGNSMAYYGVVAIPGGGRTAAPPVAVELQRLGYKSLFFGDSDAPISPTADALRLQGVKVVQWDDAFATEQRIAADLPLEGVQKMVQAACALHEEEKILDGIRSSIGELQRGVELHGGKTISEWKQAGVSEANIRTAVGLTAKRQEWFKDINSGLALGKVVMTWIGHVPNSDLAVKLKTIAEWCYA